MSRLYLTGGLRLDGPDGVITDADLPGNQGRIALAVLAVERRPISQDAFADIVWNGAPPTQWRSALAPMISKLRSLVSSTGLRGRDMLQSGGGAYQMVAPPDLWVDLEDAQRRLDRAEGAIRHQEYAAASASATVASAILRRPFLTGVDNLWVDEQRRWQAGALYRCSIVLASAWTHLGDQQLAVTAAETAIGIDPLREVGYRLLIEAERARGDNGAALRAFERCEQVLAEELEMAPSAETRSLVAGLRG